MLEQPLCKYPLQTRICQQSDSLLEIYVQGERFQEWKVIFAYFVPSSELFEAGLLCTDVLDLKIIL